MIRDPSRYNQLGKNRKSLDPSAERDRRDKKRVTGWIRLHSDEKTVEPAGKQTVKRPSEQGKSQRAEGSDKEREQT
jgi:hypothetical protein